MDKSCTSCGKHEHYGKGLCKACYMHQWNIDNKEKRKEYRIKKRDIIKENVKRWNQNNPEKVKIINERSRRKRGDLPMSENRDCSSFLGVHVAERVLSNVFDDVIKLPYGNPGFDFVCNKGKKIDVKSSCMRFNSSCATSWLFHTCKNKIADYILCIAFDNRENLNPMYMWLIPVSDAKKQTGISISITTLSKWDKYKLNIDKTIICCDMMKSG